MLRILLHEPGESMAYGKVADLVVAPIGAVALAVALAMPAMAHRDTPQARHACMGDVVRLCLGQTTPREIWRCLDRERAKLSPACAAHVD